VLRVSLIRRLTILDDWGERLPLTRNRSVFVWKKTAA
jgi:hypothetical protein